MIFITPFGSDNSLSCANIMRLDLIVYNVSGRGINPKGSGYPSHQLRMPPGHQTKRQG